MGIGDSSSYNWKYYKYNVTDCHVGEYNELSIPSLTLSSLLTVYCRYSGYFSPPWSERKYEYNQEFWMIWFARLAFVVVFQTGVSLSVLILRLVRNTDY